MQYLIPDGRSSGADSGKDEVLAIVGVTLAALSLTTAFLFICFSSAVT